MNTKQELTSLLEESSGRFLSGNDLAERLQISRAAVWKSIKALQSEGYRIEAVPNRGYRLEEGNDVISENLIRRYLGESSDLFELEVFKEVVSTNQILREKANEVSSWHTIVADSQSGGRGRYARSFFSPPGTGLYLSTLLRLSLPAMEAARITTAAAVAACRAIEECTPEKPLIKWVNDVYVHDRKVCGILTEASVSMESGGLNWAVMGIGFNVYEPEEGFPEEIRETAGAFAESRQNNLRCRIAASFLRQFYEICKDLMNKELVDEYRSRSFLIGRKILVLRKGQSIPAFAEDIDQNCGLMVRYPDGSREVLSSGEVSIRFPGK